MNTVFSVMKITVQNVLKIEFHHIVCVLINKFHQEMIFHYVKNANRDIIIINKKMMNYAN